MIVCVVVVMITIIIAPQINISVGRFVLKHKFTMFNILGDHIPLNQNFLRFKNTESRDFSKLSTAKIPTSIIFQIIISNRNML